MAETVAITGFRRFKHLQDTDIRGISGKIINTERIDGEVMSEIMKGAVKR